MFIHLPLGWRSWGNLLLEALPDLLTRPLFAPKIDLQLTAFFDDRKIALASAGLLL